VIQQMVMSLAVAFVLVATRMAAFIAVSPFPGASTPTHMRIGLVILLSAAATPMAALSRTPAIGLPLAVAVLGDAMTGAAIGFVFRVGLSAAEILGSTLAHSMGLTFAASYDPVQASNTDALTRVFTSAGMLVAFAVGAHRVVIGAAIASFRVVPLGGFLDLQALAPGMLAWISRSIECGLGLAVPAMTVSIVVQVALGLVARAAPSLQIFSVGLAVSLGSGLVVLLAGARDSFAGVAAHFGDLRFVFERVIAPGS